MKKQIFTLFVSLVLVFTTTFASARDGKVPDNIKSEFSRVFFFANNVQWENAVGYYKASFNAFDKTLFAYYTQDADFIGVAVNILSSELPSSLQLKLKSDNKDFWITGLFKVVTDNKTTYFAELQNANEMKLLKSDDNVGWSYYKTEKKD